MKAVILVILFTVLCFTALYKAAERDARLIKEYKSGQLSQYSKY